MAATDRQTLKTNKTHRQIVRDVFWLQNELWLCFYAKNENNHKYGLVLEHDPVR